MTDSSRPDRLRIFRPLLFTTLLLLLGLALWGFVIEPDRLVIRHTTIALPDWPAAPGRLRIAALSDLHVGANFITLEKLQQITSLVNSQQPDLIVLLGDYVRNNHDDDSVKVLPETLVQPLAQLHARYGVYAVLGNHDWWFDGERTKRAFEQAGIRMLENEAERIVVNEQTIWLAGLGDFWTNHHDPEKACRKISQTAPVIAITHCPDIFPE